MKKIALQICCFLCVNLLIAQPSYTPSKENMATRQWFEEARFGMFIHWGPSSTLGHGEWVMNNRNIHVDDYTHLKQFFNPQAFDAKAWVTTAKAAGMKYITFITRHHDGFSLWDTKASDWNIMQTPYQKDILKQLADECAKQDMKLFLYYSLLDWYRTDYQYETGKTGKGTGRTEKSNWPSYIAFMKAQLTELLTNYGPIAGIWFDGHWDQLDSDHDKNAKSKVNWHYDEIYPLIHRLQPACMVGNNHHLEPIEGEDFQMFEKDLPGGNTTGWGGAPVSNQMPLETCETINTSWGYNITDRSYKTPKQLIHYLIKAAGLGSNFLLNIGPMPDGTIQPEFSKSLKAMGDWLKLYGHTIYGTKGGHAANQPWGTITQKGNTCYLHILNEVQDKILLPAPFKVTSLKMLNGKKSVPFTVVNGDYIVIDIKGIELDDVDTILVMEKQ